MSLAKQRTEGFKAGGKRLQAEGAHERVEWQIQKPKQRRRLFLRVPYCSDTIKEQDECYALGFLIVVPL